MVLHAPVERLPVPVVREAELPDAPLVAQAPAPVRGAVLQEAVLEGLPAAHADGVEQVVVDVVRPQELQRLPEHRLAAVERLLLRREVGELRREDVVLAVVAARPQRRAKPLLRFAAAVRRRGVEVVDAVLEQVLDLAVHEFLVDVRRRIAVLDPAVGVSAVHRRQAHRAVAEQGDGSTLVRLEMRGHAAPYLLPAIFPKIDCMPAGSSGCMSTRSRCFTMCSVPCL